MAKRSLGTQMLVNSGVIAGLTSIGGLNLSAETIDTTTLDSDGGYKTFIKGFKDGGEVSVSGHFEPGDTNGQIALYDAFENEENAIPFVIMFPQGASWAFNGVVTEFSTSAELEDIISFEATIKVSGKPTLGFTASNGLTGLLLTGTGGTLAPAFDAGKRSYAFSGVTGTTVKVKATGAGQAINLFVDGKFVQNLVSGTDSGDIPLAASGTSKKLTIMASEANKAPKIYEIIVVKTA